MKTLSILVLTLLIVCLCNIQSKAQLPKNYQAGCYYDTSGVKHTGLIDFNVSMSNFYDRINFKTSDSAKNQKVPIAAIKSVLLDSDPDTIHVYTEWDTATYERTQYFGQLCTSTPSTHIYSRVHLKYHANGVDVYSVGSPGINVKAPGGTVHISGTPSTATHYGSYGSTASADIQYLYEIDGSLTLPIYRSNYKEVLTKAFADDPELVAKIKNKTLKFPDMKEIIEDYQSFKGHAKSK
ncbi:MAG: hypothetical protein JST50_00055 [Bacteroidetes bacterium]|jgi:hypothetical protein|nr:hypothetical protein [Bacteroidota bacterium]